jgi:FTR1 family protein
MFEGLVITLREGVEAALILAIAISVLRRRGLDRLIPALAAGATIAVLASIVVAWLASRMTWDEELAEGIAELTGAVLVGSLVWWMWRAGPNMKDEIESGLHRMTAEKPTLAGSLGVLLFAFGMVFREGVETAVFLSATAFNTEGVGRWIGALAGLVLAILFGVMFVRGTLRVPLKPFFSLTSAVLLLVAAQLLIGGLHELSEAEVIPSSRAEMAIVGPIIKNELLLFTLTVALAAGWLLFGPRTSRPAPVATEGPEARLARADRLRERNWRRISGVIGLVVVAFLSMAFVLESKTPAKVAATPVPIVDGAATVDVSAARDGNLHFYQAAAGGVPVRFFVIDVEGTLKVCADACEICGDQGYFQDGHQVVCRNCTAPIARQTLGRSGGCNPIPITSNVQGNRLSIAETELQALVPRLHGR